MADQQQRLPVIGGEFVRYPNGTGPGIVDQGYNEHQTLERLDNGRWTRVYVPTELVWLTHSVVTALAAGAAYTEDTARWTTRRYAADWLEGMADDVARFVGDPAEAVRMAAWMLRNLDHDVIRRGV